MFFSFVHFQKNFYAVQMEKMHGIIKIHEAELHCKKIRICNMDWGLSISQAVTFQPLTAENRECGICSEHSGVCTDFTVTYGFTEGNLMDLHRTMILIC
jgi:hypothetical protein